MIDIILFMFLLAGIAIGLKRGFILQVFHIVGSIIAVIAAISMRERVAPMLHWIPMPPIENTPIFQYIPDHFEAFYYGTIAFILLFFVVKTAMSILASFLNVLASIPIIKEINKIGGGLLGFAEIYLVLFVLLYIGAFFAGTNIQVMVAESTIANYMLYDTPYLSEALRTFNPMSYVNNNFSF
ncbi:CvpA family protein [Bacillus sp. REN10]|uniref:CvpA family protein n=1 Tax=Bacillus sp. REN10 TaxID=2782541 RepID=UPI00193B3581|nr:CvpA family protein [Bacillus sp. REN10]